VSKPSPFPHVDEAIARGDIDSLYEPRACCCLGPDPGETLCYCKRRAEYIERRVREYQIGLANQMSPERASLPDYGARDGGIDK